MNINMMDIGNVNDILNEGAAVRLGGSPSNETETHVYFDACEESKTVTLPDCTVESTGRTLEVCMTLRNVAPGKRTAVSVTLTEMDGAGKEYARGFRCVTVPAHNNAACCDITMPRIRFIMPEDIRLDGSAGACSGRRHFVLRSSNHYVDTVTTY